MSYAQDPKRVTAQHPFTCHCGYRVGKGEPAVFYPRGHKLVCTDCGDPDIQACRVEDGTSYFP